MRVYRRGNPQAVWCLSGAVPITPGNYAMDDGTKVTVKQARSGRFYAVVNGRYAPGMVWRLRAELESKAAHDG